MVCLGIGVMVVPVIALCVIVVMPMTMRMLVIMPVRMIVMVLVLVIMIMLMIIMAMQRRPWQAMFPAKRLVAAGGIAITLAWTIFKPAANAFHMMVMTGLWQADLCLKAKHLLAIFAQLAIHHGSAVKYFL